MQYIGQFVDDDSCKDKYQIKFFSTKNFLMKDIFLIGMVWSGKWTQARKILQKYPQYQYFEMGWVLRALKNSDNIFQNYISEKMDKWDLLDDSFVNSLYRAYLTTLSWRPALIDGFPRRLEQSILFWDMLKLTGRNINWIWINISSDTAIKRLTNRKTCPKCWKTYNQTVHESEKCDVCNVELIIRADDKPDIILKRILNYVQETTPVIEFFQKKWLIYEVDGNLSWEEIFAQIEKILN